MKRQPSDFWAKADTVEGGGEVLAWHPLPDHCADVAAVTEALLALPVWARRLNRLAARALGRSDLARLCVLAALHDIGKFNIGFQAKVRPELGRPTAGHVREAVAALTRSDVFSCLDELGEWGDGTGPLLLAALCHHGRPFAVEGAISNWQPVLWKPTGGLDPRAGVRDLLGRCRSWFPSAFAGESGRLPDSAALTHAFAGLVTLADWIASDTLFFPYSEEGETDRWPTARARAGSALREIGLDIPPALRVDPYGRSPFARVSEYEPRPTQRAILDLPMDDGSVSVLEAETGSGKTEAALARFVALFEAGLVDGLYFALPTRTAATQMHGRVYAAVRRAFVSAPPVVLAVPGYLRVDDASGTRLPGFEVRWSDEERFRSRGWAGENAKRYLAGTIAVGTIDQVLLSSLMVPHSHLRGTSLLRQLLVVDEVHASDAYMGRILRDVLARHLSAGGHALLLSATLGSEARACLLDPAAQAAGTPTLDEALASPYPCLSHRSSETSARAVDADGRERRVGVDTRPWLDDVRALAAAAAQAARDGARVLVIRNTVTDCVATQMAVERELAATGRADLLFTCAGVAAPHHSRFARADREALDLALEARLGRKRSGGGCVVVATQTVQQSLDLDADVLFSDLCPADVLLQRMGRLHRHPRSERERPAGFETPTAVVVVPQERDLGRLIGRQGKPSGSHGLGTVYEDLRILEATWRLLETHTVWSVPTMNRYLVERSLHSSILQAIVEHGGSSWQAHANHIQGTAYGHMRQADLNLVDRTVAYAERAFPDGTAERIATRLGEGDRQVRFEPPVPGPFGTAVTELVVPARWAVGADPEEVAPRRVTVGAAVRFTFGGREFEYDRLGMRLAETVTATKEVSGDDGP